MYFLELDLTKKPKSLNRKLRSHWTVKHRENQEWDTYIAMLTARRKPIAPLQKARVDFVWEYYRPMDFDGFVGALKPVVDALVSAGIIEDDKWDCIGSWTIDYKFRPKKEGFLLRLTVSSE